MEKIDSAAVPEGKHRDGCLLVDDRYVNAAKDLGLGNGKGACARPLGAARRLLPAHRPRLSHAPPPPSSSLLPPRALNAFRLLPHAPFPAGVYGHLKSLTRMGDGAGDAPTGTSMGVDRSVKGVVAATGWGAKGTDLLKDAAPSAIQQAAREGALKTTATGMANVHGFSHKLATGSKLHTGASSFTHQKGVINTLGGARDITREEKDQGLPPRGEKRAQVTIATIGSLDTWAAEGKAKKEAAMAKIAAAGKAPSLGGGGGGGVHTLNDKPARKHQPNLPPTGGIATIHAPSKGPIRPSAVVSGASSSSRGGAAVVLSSGGKLGGGAVLGGSSGNGMHMTDAEKRVAYLEKKEAERRALLAANE
jgi:hypothetical protein